MNKHKLPVRSCGHEACPVLDDNEFSMIYQSECMGNNPNNLCTDCWIRTNLPEVFWTSSGDGNDECTSKRSILDKQN